MNEEAELGFAKPAHTAVLCRLLAGWSGGGRAQASRGQDADPHRQREAIAYHRNSPHFSS